MTSEIRTNSFKSRAGLSTVTMTDSGPMFSGITTFVDNSGFTFGVGGGTSIFTPATNVLTFGTNNTEKIRIDASGHMHGVGVITATHFYGDGSNLTGISAGTSLSGSTNNTVCTVTGANAIQGEAKLLLGATTSAAGQLIIKDATNAGNQLWMIGRASDNTSSVSFRNNADNAYIARIQCDSNAGMQFEMAGSEKLRLDSSGRLLIGTTTEGNATGDNLTISDSGNMGMTLRSTDSNYCNIYFSDAETGTAEYEGYISYNHNTNSLEFATGHTERLRITSEGQVKLSGTNSGNHMSSFGTNVGGLTIDDVGNQHTALEVSHGSNKVFLVASSNNSVYMSSYGTGNFILEHTGGGGTRERLRIDSNGDLGLGIAAVPQDSGARTLHIHDTTTGSAARAAIRLTHGSSGTAASNGAFIGFDNNPDFYLYNQESGKLRFGTNGNERMVIESSASGQKPGRVLVGPSVPTSGDDSQMIIRNNESNGIYRCLRLNNQSNNNRITMSFEGGGTNTGDIRINGSTTNYNSYSDYRLKENVVPLTDPITRLKTLKPYRFNFIASPDITLDGFFAHEVSPTVAEAVGGEKDEVDTDGNVVPQALDMAKLVPLLTASLQEAITKIETLEQDNIALRVRVTNLEGN